MFGLSHLLAGLCVAHVLWLVAYVTGTLVDARSPRPETPGSALTELVARTACGIAILGFTVFLFGSVGLLNLAGIALVLAGLAAAGRAVHGPGFYGRAFWADQTRRVGAAWTRGNLLTYYIALALIVPSVWPDAASDSVRYHLAYAADWAVHGRIYTDVFLTLPFYANNFVLVYALFEVLHAGPFIHFAVWMCGALAILSVRAALLLATQALSAASNRFEALSRDAVTLILPATIAVSPAFLHWMNTALIDIPIEAFAFIPALCAVAACLANRDLRWTAVLCAAFTIGMKMTFIALIPLYAWLIWVAFAALGQSRRAAALACAVMLLAASPWYVRNLILDHDPVPPVVNAAFHHHDQIWNPRELKRVASLSDLHPDRSLGALATLPYRIWADPLSPFREYGNIALFLFLYVPFGVVAGAMMMGARMPRGRATVVMCATSAYGLLYLIMTAYLGRYLLMIQPPLAVSVGMLLLWLPAVRLGAIARVALALVTIVPTPRAMTFDWYHQMIGYYNDLEYYSDADAILTRNLPGYPQALRLMRSPEFARRPAPHVLLLRTDVHYYLHEAGIDTVGDWNGPGRYVDFLTALENDRLADYVRDLDIGGVIEAHDASLFTRQQEEAVRSAFEKLGFRVLEQDATYFVAVRTGRTRAPVTTYENRPTRG